MTFWVLSKRWIYHFSRPLSLGQGSSDGTFGDLHLVQFLDIPGHLIEHQGGTLIQVVKKVIYHIVVQDS